MVVISLLRSVSIQLRFLPSLESDISSHSHLLYVKLRINFVLSMTYRSASLLVITGRVPHEILTS